MTDAHIMKMPIKRFWLYSECVDRLNAADDMRALGVGLAINSGDAFKQKIEELNKAIGTVVNKSFKLDREGVKSLKARLLM